MSDLTNFIRFFQKVNLSYDEPEYEYDIDDSRHILGLLSIRVEDGSVFSFDNLGNFLSLKIKE